MKSSGHVTTMAAHTISYELATLAALHQICGDSASGDEIAEGLAWGWLDQSMKVAEVAATVAVGVAVHGRSLDAARAEGREFWEDNVGDNNDDDLAYGIQVGEHLAAYPSHWRVRTL